MLPAMRRVTTSGMQLRTLKHPKTWETGSKDEIRRTAKRLPNLTAQKLPSELN